MGARTRGCGWRPENDGLPDFPRPTTQTRRRKSEATTGAEVLADDGGEARGTTRARR